MPRTAYNRYCDRFSRRDVIQAGISGGCGLSLSGLLGLRAKCAERGVASPDTAVIFVALGGGPTQHETYDPKPDAPQEYRGPFGVVATRLPSTYFSETMIEQAKVMDKLAIIRSIHHESNSHTVATHLVQTGYYSRSGTDGFNEMPCAGSIVSKVRTPRGSALPAFVSIPSAMRFGRAGWLGMSHNPFETVQSPAGKDFRIPNLNLVDGITLDRLSDRRRLLAGFDATRRILDTQGAGDAVSDFGRQAFEMVTTDDVRIAFDIAREDAKTREQYGMNDLGQGMLLARRLVENGVPFVSVGSGGWDNHGSEVCGFTLEDNLKKRGPIFDRAVAALVSDLYQRGFDQKVLVVAMGEFGRTPRVNDQAGRDHWAPVMSVLISGGGLAVGQVIGASDAKGGYPVASPYRPENVLHMIYRHLGIDPSLTFIDHAGRPRYVLERRGLIDELV